jgi:phosphate/phosphite/phosphonate ABC transporter binding protein
MEIIVPADSAIKTPADIKGKKLAFTAPTSNSGFKAPSALLESEFNLIAKRDYEPVFSGKHDNSVLGVANKDYDAAAIANEVMFRMFERRRQGEDPDDLQIGNFPDHRLWRCAQSRSGPASQDQGSLLHLSVGRLIAPGRVQGPG